MSLKVELISLSSSISLHLSYHMLFPAIEEELRIENGQYKFSDNVVFIDTFQNQMR